MINIKLSEYIEQLQKIQEKYGDIDCVRWIENNDWDSSTQGWYEPYYDNIEDYVSDFACVYKDTEGNKRYATTNEKGYIDCQQVNVLEL